MYTLLVYRKWEVEIRYELDFLHTAIKVTSVVPKKPYSTLKGSLIVIFLKQFYRY